MKKLILIFAILVLFAPFALSMVIKGGVELSNKVPKGFYGSWQVKSTQTYTNNPQLFNGTSTDYWNLSKSGDVITLSNPVSGAQASVAMDEVDGNRIRFTRTSSGKSEKVRETPSLTLEGENFYGTDKIIIEKYKFGELVRTDVVEYKITGKKISGDSASAILSQ